MPIFRLSAWTAAALIVVLAMIAGPLAAKARVLCGKDVEETHPLAWASIAKRHAALVAAENWRGLFEALGEELDRSTLHRQSDPPRSRHTESETFLRVVQYVQAHPEQLANAETIFTETALGARPPSVNLFFNGGEPIWNEFHPRLEQVQLNHCDESGALPAHLNELRYYAIAFRTIAIKINLKDRTDTLKAVSTLEQQYDAYLFNGFPMYWWESRVNQIALTPDNIMELPRHQFIIAHPSFGFLHERENKVFRPTLTVHFGYVYYPDAPSYSSWWGASLFRSYTDGIGTASGAALHYNHYALGWAQQRNTAIDGGDRTFVFMSVELYQAFRNKEDAYAGYRKQVRQQAQEWLSK